MKNIKIDKGFCALWDEYRKATAVAESKFAPIVRYVRVNGLSREVVQACLRSRGLSPNSVNSESSRIMRLASDAMSEVLSKVEQGEITLRAMRKLIVRSPRAARSIKTPLEKADYLFTQALSIARQSPSITLQDIIGIIIQKWQAVESVDLKKAS